MKAVKYLFAFWAGVLVYASLAVVFGAKGFSAYKQLEREQIKQEANIESLKLINRELEDTVNTLLYDKETLTVLAREQGYATRQERFIRIVGLGVSKNTGVYAGEVVSAADPQYTSERTIRIISFFTGITILICMAAFDFMKYLRYH